jgi:hypothetical protein
MWGTNFPPRPYAGHETAIRHGAHLRKSGAYTTDAWRSAAQPAARAEDGFERGLDAGKAERALRQAHEAELTTPPPAHDARGRTVDDAANALRDRLELQGARNSYRQNCESMQRVHISPAMGSRRVAEVTTADVEALARSMLRRGLAPKSVRNVITFLHSVFGLATTPTDIYCVRPPTVAASVYAAVLARRGAETARGIFCPRCSARS